MLRNLSILLTSDIFAALYMAFMHFYCSICLCAEGDVEAAVKAVDYLCRFHGAAPFP